MWNAKDPLISSMGLHDLGLTGKMLRTVVKFFNSIDYLMDNRLSEFQYKIVTDSLCACVCMRACMCVECVCRHACV